MTQSRCKTAERRDHKRNGLWRATLLCLLHTCVNHLPRSPSVSQTHHLFIVLRTCVMAEISLAPRVLAISCFYWRRMKRERALYRQRQYVELAAKATTVKVPWFLALLKIMGYMHLLTYGPMNCGLSLPTPVWSVISDIYCPQRSCQPSLEQGWEELMPARSSSLPCEPFLSKAQWLLLHVAPLEHGTARRKLRYSRERRGKFFPTERSLVWLSGSHPVVLCPSPLGLFKFLPVGDVITLI